MSEGTRPEDDADIESAIAPDSRTVRFAINDDGGAAQAADARTALLPNNTAAGATEPGPEAPDANNREDRNGNNNTGNGYGATTAPNSTTTTTTATGTVGGQGSQEFVSPNNRMRLRALRAHTQAMTVLSFLRRKYLDRFLISLYFTTLVGLAPLGVWLYIEFERFAKFYLLHAQAIHIAVQLMNIVLLYLFVTCAFNLQALFASMGVNTYLGNIFVALCSGCLLAVECVDRISIYMHEAHYDDAGLFVPNTGNSKKSNATAVDGPTTTTAVGSVNSPFLIIMLLISLIALMTAIINLFHLLYYMVEHRRTLNRAMQHLEQDEELLIEE